MERPAWTIIVLSTLTPRELSDYVAVITLVLASLQAVFFAGGTIGSLLLLVIVPGVSLLASLSHDSRKERRELALIAYGSKSWQIHLRYFLRGAIISGLGILPLIVMGWLSSVWLLALSTVLAIAGASSYAIPSLRRVSSLDFVGRYKR